MPVFCSVLRCASIAATQLFSALSPMPQQNFCVLVFSLWEIPAKHLQLPTNFDNFHTKNSTQVVDVWLLKSKKRCMVKCRQV